MSKLPSRRAKMRRIGANQSRGKPAAKKAPSAPSSRDKVQAYRERMRAKGLRPIQMWLPDTRSAEFVAEARRQSLLANASPFAAQDQAWVDAMSDWKTD